MRQFLALLLACSTVNAEPVFKAVSLEGTSFDGKFELYQESSGEFAITFKSAGWFARNQAGNFVRVKKDPSLPSFEVQNGKLCRAYPTRSCFAEKTHTIEVEGTGVLLEARGEELVLYPPGHPDEVLTLRGPASQK